MKTLFDLPSEVLPQSRLPVSQSTSRPNPWQRNGTRLLAEATTDPAAALRQSGLNWDVEAVDLRTADTLDPVPENRAIRRSDTKKVLGVVGADFTSLQNTQMFAFFSDLAKAAPDRKTLPFTIETAGSFQGGRTVWALAHLPDLGIRLGRRRKSDVSAHLQRSYRQQSADRGADHHPRHLPEHAAHG